MPKPKRTPKSSPKDKGNGHPPHEDKPAGGRPSWNRSTAAVRNTNETPPPSATASGVPTKCASVPTCRLPIGPRPTIVSRYMLRTRPRMAGSTLSWSNVFRLARQATMLPPARTSIATDR